MSNIPSFKRIDNDRYIYGKDYHTKLTSAYYANKTSVELDGVTFNIVGKEERTDDRTVILIEVVA